MAKAASKRRVAMPSVEPELQTFIDKHATGMLGMPFVAACVRRGFDEINIADFDLQPVPVDEQKVYEVKLEGIGNTDIQRCLDECVKPKFKAVMLGQCLKVGAEIIQRESATVKLKSIVLEYLEAMDSQPAIGEAPKRLVPISDSSTPEKKPSAEMESPEQFQAAESVEADIEVETDDQVEPEIEFETVEPDFAPEFGDEPEWEGDNPPMATDASGSEFSKLINSFDPP